MQSKTANGLKKFRLNRHKAKRLQKSQKRKREHQERLASQGAFDRNDRRMGLTSWHQQNITLSHVILPNISQQDAPSKVKKPKKKKQEVSLAKEKETVPNENKKDKKLEKVEALESKNKKANAKKNDPIDLGIKMPASASGNKKMNSAEAVEERIPAHQNCAESVSLPPSSANDSNHTKLCNGHGDGTTMPLAIDIDCQAAAGMESPLTKCSVDSGVGADSTTNGVLSACACGDASMVADPSSCQSFSPPLESAEQADKNGEMEKNTKANVNGVADTGKLEQQRVYEFVDQVTERLKIQTLVANNEIAPMLLQSIKVEPLNLERIKLAERKRVKKPRQYKLLDSDIQYCRYMEEKYGRDFEAMSQDPRNIFGDSARSLERKVRIYKDFLRQGSEI